MTRRRHRPFKARYQSSTTLSFGESLREALHVVLQAATVAQELNVGTVHLDTTSRFLLQVLVTTEGSEAPVLGDDDLLPARELVLGSSKSLKSVATVRVTSAHAHDDLTNVDAGHGSVGLAPGTTHSSLQSIGTSARQHLVDADNVEWVGAHTEVEAFLSSRLDEVLVGANASGLEGLRAQLFILVGDEVNAEREIVDVRTLSAKVEDSDLGVGYTTVEAGLGIRLGEDRVSIPNDAKYRHEIINLLAVLR